MKDIRAWTGGSNPAPFSEISPIERQVVRALFRQDCKTWIEFWRTRIPIDIARVIWIRARYDAHSTIRDTIK